MPVQLRILAALLVIFLGTATWAQPPQDAAPPLPPNQVALPDDPATVIAVVGQTPILWGDIQPKVDGRINEVLRKLKREYPKSELTRARTQLGRSALAQAIRNKIMRECFLLDQVGTQAADKRQEAAEMMDSRARQMFFENELKALQKKHGTEDLTELDQILRKDGASLLSRQRDFADMMLGHMYMRSKIEQDPEVTIAEISGRYDRDQEKYHHGARARWEQLSVLFSNHPSREAAHKAISEMGREAYFGGNLQAIARQKSEEPFADDGGVHDWTTQGSLASKSIDEQVFSIPLNRMSEIIEDAQGMHIIRVLEREPAGVKPLAALQDEIREELKKEKIVAAQNEMLKQMQQRVPVWSMYPDDFPGAKPLRGRTARRPDSNSTQRF
ncbi:MAG: peptidylprolyl isomerase [Planctomycetota bacterium]